jgi:RHS repeat-associated protein
VATVLVVLLLAPPALADVVRAEAYGWFKYGTQVTREGYVWYPYTGYFVDQDPATPNTQILIANSKPVTHIQFYAPRYYSIAGYPTCFIYNSAYGTLPASSVPRLVTVSLRVGTIRATGANNDERIADAARRFQAGYFVFYYTDGTTSVVRNDLGGLDPAQAEVFGDTSECNFTDDPINTSSGNLTDRLVDLAIPGKGPALTFTRTYNSQSASSWGLLGRGWRCEYQVALEFPSATEVACIAADGRREVFVAAGGGSYTSPAGVTDSLVENGDGSFTLTHLDQSRLEFDSAGRLVNTADRYGNTTTLEYDLVEVQASPLTVLTGVTGAGGRSLSFTYDADYAYLAGVQDSAGRTVSFDYDTGGNLVSVTDPNGRTTTYAYDADHHLLSTQEPGSANPLITNIYTEGKVTSQIDALGNETSLAYDTEDQETTVTDARGNVSVDAWDAGYRITSHTDPLGHSTSVVYNTAGLPASITDQNGHVTAYQYDSLGNPTSTVDPLGRETTAAYDTANGNPLWSEDAAGRRTTYLWDPTGIFLNSVVSPVGTTSFTYNPDGSLATMTDDNSHIWSYAYSAAGDLTSATDPLGEQITYEYDGAGRRTALVDANGSRTEYVFDPVGQLTTVKNALAQTDPLNRHQVDIVYDANGNQTQVTDANGNVSSFAYDDMSLLTTATDALGGQASYTYDPSYNLTAVRDPNGHTTVYGYDPNNRLSGITDPLGRLTGFTYDPAGNLTGVAYPNGNQVSYAYTAADQLAQVSYGGAPATWLFTYNVTGTLAQVAKDDGRTWSFSHDAADRLLTATDRNNPALGPFSVAYAYDGVGNLTGLTLGSLSPLAYSYNARNELVSLTGPGGATAFTYDDAGRLTQIATPGASTRSFSYDAVGNITGVTNLTAGGSQAFAYSHDANGNVVAANTESYTYDALNRLTGWTHYEGLPVVTTYTYDAAGNLLQEQEDRSGTITIRSFGYNAANEITNDGFTYDANGNLTSDGVRTFAYDAEDRLVQVQAGGQTLACMTYDHEGRRASLTTATGTTYFHYDGSLLAAESDASGAITATYAYDDAGLLISMTRGGSTYFYQTNAHGDVVSLTDTTGAVVNTYAYDPWGLPLSSSETVENPFRYASYYYDSSTELYYLLNRYYDPDLKRFLTLDPVGGLLARPESFNLYVYCENNPLAYTDSSGLFIDTLFDLGCFGGDVYQSIKGGRKNLGENLLYAGIDLGCLLIPGVTGGGDIVRGFQGFGRYFDNYNDLINGLEAATKGARPRNFRSALAHHSGGAVPGSHAHHVFPRKFADKFAGKIDLSDPAYGEWWKAQDHLKNAYGYNKRWEGWLQDHPDASPEEILQFGRELMTSYGFTPRF